MRRTGGEDYAIPRSYRAQFEGFGYRLAGETPAEFAAMASPTPVRLLKPADTPIEPIVVEAVIETERPRRKRRRSKK